MLLYADTHGHFRVCPSCIWQHIGWGCQLLGNEMQDMLCRITGFLPPSLVAVNAEVQRRIDAKQSCNQPQQQQEQQLLQQESVDQQEQQQPPLKQEQQPPVVDPQQPGLAPATPSRFGAGVPASMLSSDSIAPELMLPPSLVNSSSISSNLSSQGSSPVQRLQLGSQYPAALSDTELVKMGETGSDSSQTSFDSAAPVVVLPAHVLETFGPGQPGEQIQGKKSKTQKAKGLLSSFTGGCVSTSAFVNLLGFSCAVICDLLCTA